MKIISGKLKGMKIKIPKNLNIRPTTSKIRKILFEWLNNFIKNKKCLDCFCGSGSLSIESISRKAIHITMLEINYKTIKILKKNTKKINNKYFTIIKTNTIKWIKQNKNNKFDIIFIDPPYKKKYILNKTIQYLEKNKHTKKNTFIYIETDKKNNSIKIPITWKIYKKKILKQNKHLLFIKIEK